MEIVLALLIGGAFGAILTGVFATVGAAGLIAGNPGQVLIQLIGVVAAGAYAAIVTAILLFILKPIMGLRVDAEDEAKGLDQTAHHESGYNF